jgi:hypothetical protein
MTGMNLLKKTYSSASDSKSIPSGINILKKGIREAED